MTGISMRIIAGILVVTLLAAIGCGSASNNDQGVSFTMLGYSVAGTAGAGTGGTTAACSTSPNLSGGTFPISTDTETAGSTNEVLVGVVVQNNLTTQFIRTQSIALEYIIPGAEIQPPSTAVPYGGVVAQAGGLQCGVVALVPPQILSWLNLNRGSLPELPFMLIVRGQVTGTTVAGDVLTSNPVDIGFTVVADNVIPPTGADDEASGIVEEGTIEGDDTDLSDPEIEDGGGSQI
jgi:hypothetical protein